MLEDMKTAAILILAMLLGACDLPPDNGAVGGRSAQAGAASDSAATRGASFAQNRCSDCHAVGSLQTSPIPTAPSFEAIANAPGLTAESLSQWLRTSHDFPREMYFEIPAERIDDLAAYMLTLRKDDYEPPMGLAPDSSTPTAGGSLEGRAAANR
jgi:mono/diheme cytochrome c family protein